MLDATAGSAWRAAYEEVWQRLLRPWRKHGYPDSRVQQILESLPTDDVEYLMQYLAQQYRECSPENSH